MDGENVKNMLHALCFNLIALKDEKEEGNKIKIRENIQFEFKLLDENRVPFIIQNKVIELAEKGKSFDSNIKNILGA
jgi:23S rRNA pseudoU1915 N3-methylase RlmH